VIYTKITSKETYKVVRAVLRDRKFKQYQISKKEKVTFSLVNRIVNWMKSRGYVAKRNGYYELISPGAVFGLFPIYRQMKPVEVFDVSLKDKEVLDLMRGKAALCLSSALSNYDDYFRDTAVHAYVLDEKIIDELKDQPKGFTHIELYREDLNADDFEKIRGQKVTNKIRTVIDLFCANKAYAAERLMKKEMI